MLLKSVIDAELKKNNKTFKWLVGELGMSNDGLKAGLENESISLKNFKKLAEILNLPIETLLVSGNTHIQVQKGGKYNTQAYNSTLHEPETIYTRKEVEGLEAQIEILKNQIIDKERLIKILSKE